MAYAKNVSDVYRPPVISGSSRKRKQSHSTCSTCNKMQVSNQSDSTIFSPSTDKYTELLHNLHGQCQIDSNIYYNALEFGAYSSIREIFVYLNPAARISWTFYLFLKKDDIKHDLEGNYDLKIYDDMDILSSLFRMHKIQLNQYVLTALKLAIPYFIFRITFKSFVEDDRIGWIQQNS
ncbi:hypothetical protein ACFE04_000100 [Oxalis oulophora]